MSKKNITTKTKDTATFIAKLADDKIASDIIMMDLSTYEDSPADVFIICTSDSSVQSVAILDHIRRECRKSGLNRPKVEGDKNSDWILIDFFDVVVHIMNKESRAFYKIEHCWKDAVFYKYSNNTGKFRKDNKYLEGV